MVPFLLGTLTTIATAWLLSLRPLEAMFESREPTDLETDLVELRAERVLLEVSVERGVGWMWLGARHEAGHARMPSSSPPALAWRRVNNGLPDCLEEPLARMSQTASGWPMLSMMYAIEPGGTVASGIRVVTRPHPFWSSRTPPQALPLRPLWRGFVVNTIVFIALWWALLDGVPTARRALRRKAGTCRGCGYALGDSTRCPECGRNGEPFPAAGKKSSFRSRRNEEEGN